MKEKKVSRFWCDHCNRAGLQRWRMVKHEERCTKNPKRKCGMCELAGDGGSDGLEVLLALLPDPKSCFNYQDDSMPDSRKEYLDGLALMERQFRDAAGQCPACMMAAFRQKGIPVPAVEWFDYKAESLEIFSEIENAKEDSHYY